MVHSNSLQQTATRRRIIVLPLAIGLLMAMAVISTGQDVQTPKTKSTDASPEYLKLTSGPITLSNDPSMAGRIASMTNEGQEV